MMILDTCYLIDCKKEFNPGQANSPQWDYFISALNDSDRVKSVFASVAAKVKRWLILPEYKYSDAELLIYDSLPLSEDGNEADVIIHAFENLLEDMDVGATLCIDVTGMMRPHILFMLFLLKNKGVQSFDLVYTEPLHYRRKEETEFASEDVYEVRQVAGFEGIHPSRIGDDVLIIGLGYDHHLISHVIESKPGARIIQMHSLPSLSADMYQESLLRLERVSSSFASMADSREVYCSANDPFLVSAVLAENISRLEKGGGVSNIYLSPLATKPQVVGFGLFYLNNKSTIPISMIFPFSSRYERETSKGVGRSWVYPIRF
ncbi:hypothetical protein [Delftia acidovorans]|uniref:hypothetical protein n=1 Tax=Delftia acidovorans TaxID=80866 RepID=UPI0028AA15F8|nr:hypothetical protein [Delftia acidovorans]